MAEHSVRVVVEVGKTWVFASALDWPGWARRGKGEHAALDALLAYADRYAPVAGDGFAPGALEVIDTLPGTGTTDFGAPDAVCDADRVPADATEADRLASILERSWLYLDSVVAGAPAELRKGPRGGGRDRDAIAEHVREAERSYARTVGLRLPPRTPWSEQRESFAGALRSGASGSWPTRYALRRTAWHVLDHAWEIQDRVMSAPR